MQRDDVTASRLVAALIGGGLVSDGSVDGASTELIT